MTSPPLPLLCSLTPLVGAGLVRLAGHGARARRLAIGTTVLTLSLAGAMVVGLSADGSATIADPVASWLVVDALGLMLLALTALLTAMVVLAAPSAWSNARNLALLLTGESLTITAFAAADVRLLTLTWVASLVPVFWALRSRAEPGPARVFGGYLGSASVAFVAAIVLLGPGRGRSGWTLDGWADRANASPLGLALLLFAVYVRKAIFPFHSWLPRVFGAQPPGPALLLVAPMLGAYALVRLALPLVPAALGSSTAWVGAMALLTAVYAAGLALVQRRLDQIVAWLAISQSATVLVGLEATKGAGMVGGLVTWLAAGTALTAWGLVAWSLEARYGPLEVGRPLGLYRRTPMLAIVFLVCGLSLVAMPGTVGFAADDLLVRAVLESFPYAGLLLFVATALNGFTVLRTFMSVFYGRPAEGDPIDALPRERIAFLVPLALVVALGVQPAPIVSAGAAAAERILASRPR